MLPLSVLLALLAAAPGPGRAPSRAAAPAAPAPAAATPEQVRARARALLGGIDRPVPLEAFRRLGPEGEAALADIARSGDLPAFRARALGALASLGAPRAAEVHLELARPPAPRAVRRAAAHGLGRLLPPAEALAALGPVLAEDRDRAVRAAAAEALASASPGDGCAAVRAQARREGGPARAAFARALGACDRPRPGPGLSR